MFLSSKETQKTFAPFIPFCEIKFLSLSVLCPRGNKSSFSHTAPAVQLHQVLFVSLSRFFSNLWQAHLQVSRQRVKGHRAYRGGHLRVDGTSWFLLPRGGKRGFVLLSLFVSPRLNRTWVYSSIKSECCRWNIFFSVFWVYSLSQLLVVVFLAIIISLDFFLFVCLFVFPCS